jgi:CHASE2 domain-containing sensor protein
MRGLTKRDAVAIILIAVACGAASTLPPFNLIHGWSIDALTALRWEAFGTRRDPATTPVTVIAIDEETYQTPPFKGSPTLTWTTELGRVLSAVIDGGAKVAGFDIVFPTSIEQSERLLATIFWARECAASTGPSCDLLRGALPLARWCWVRP